MKGYGLLWLIVAAIFAGFKDIKISFWIIGIGLGIAIALLLIEHLSDFIKNTDWKAVTDFIFFAILMCLGLGLMISGINKSAWLIVFGLLFTSIGLIFFFKKKSA